MSELEDMGLMDRRALMDRRRADGAGVGEVKLEDICAEWSGTLIDRGEVVLLSVDLCSDLVGAVQAKVDYHRGTGARVIVTNDADRTVALLAAS